MCEALFLRLVFPLLEFDFADARKHRRLLISGGKYVELVVGNTT
jgi:hypothetical protein